MTARQRRDSRRVALHYRLDRRHEIDRVEAQTVLLQAAKAGNPCAKELLAREGRS